MIKAPWLLMLETDYVWVKPLLPFGSAYDASVPGMSFAFDYIGSRHPIAIKLYQERCPGCEPRDVIPNTGPAPVLMRFEDLRVRSRQLPAELS